MVADVILIPVSSLGYKYGPSAQQETHQPLYPTAHINILELHPSSYTHKSANMRFSSVLAFASLAFAAPTVDKRQQTVVGTVVGAVNTLERTTRNNLNAISKTYERTGNCNILTKYQTLLSTAFKTM